MFLQHGYLANAAEVLQAQLVVAFDVLEYSPHEPTVLEVNLLVE